MINALLVFKKDVLDRKWILVLLLVLLVAASFVQVYPITIMRKIVDEAVSSGEHSKILQMGVFYVLLQIISAILGYLFKSTNKKYSIHLEHRIRNRIFSHILKLPFSFHGSQKGNDEMFVDVNDSTMMSASFVIEPILFIVETLLIFAFGFYFIFSIDPILTLVIVPIGLLVTATVFFTGKKVKILAADQLESKSVLFRKMLESMKGIFPIKLAVLEKETSNSFRGLSYLFGSTAFKAYDYQIRTQAIHTFSFMLLIASVLVIGSFRVQSGELSIGGFVSVMMYNHLLVDPILGFFAFYQSYKTSSVGFKRVMRILENNAEDVYEGIVPSEHDDEFGISYNNISFSYDDGVKVLSNISLSIEEGEKLAIIGANGSGKSTLLQLLFGYSDSYSGSIKVGGIEVNAYRKSALRKRISCMPQYCYIFDDTIEQNIKFFNQDISKSDLNKIIELTGLTDLIKELNNRTTSQVGSNGIGLSGGQRQRIVLARTLAKKADIYIFDEFNAHLDAAINRTLYRNITDYLCEKTVIFVEHKHDMIECVDRIVEVINGEVKLFESSSNQEYI